MASCQIRRFVCGEFGDRSSLGENISMPAILCEDMGSCGEYCCMRTEVDPACKF